MNNPVNLNAQWQSAIAAFKGGNPKKAKSAIKPLLNHPAANGETYLLAGLIDSQLGMWPSSAKWLEQAVKQLPNHVDALLALGNAQHRIGEMEMAITSYKKVIKQIPDNPDAWNNLGVVNEDIGRLADALDCYNQTLQLNPDHALALRSRAPLLGRLRQFEFACDAYEDLLDRYPDDLALKVGYAEFLEQANRPDDALKLLPDSTLSDNKVDARAQGIRAKVLIRQDDLDGALEILTKTRKRTGENYLGYGEGIVLDKLGRFEEAMFAFKKANQWRANEWRFKRLEKQPVTEFLNFKIKERTIEPDNDIGTTDHRPIVFLTGLPRSGTTLLDRMLAAHPGIQVLEELEGLRMTETAMAEGATAAEARLIYWEFIGRQGLVDSDKLIVDKNPLHIMHLDMLPRVFPAAKTILALRHPYDAALSCYMQDFDAGPVTARFLDLKSTGVLCAQFLQLMHKYESARPELVRRLHYENLVTDFRTEITDILNFLELDWDDGIDNYAEIATRANPIMTASYEQVTRKIYRSAVARWKNYQPWLTPFKDTIGKNLGLFNYEL